MRQMVIIQQGYIPTGAHPHAGFVGLAVTSAASTWRFVGTSAAFAPPSPLWGQIAAQVVIGVAAAVPFLRRRGVYTALFMLTFWLAGLTTIVAQPVRTPSGQVSPTLHGALWALLLSDGVLVAWGTCASLLYIVHIHRAQRMPLGATYDLTNAQVSMPLRRKVALLILGQLLVLLVLVVFASFARTDLLIRQQGIWFPVSFPMPPVALLYALIGKGYILGMFSWAIYGLQHVARHFLRHPVMRLGAWLGFCVACSMLLQSLVVAVAQARGHNFYATRAGQETLSLWLTVGFVFPLGALTVVGVVNRWRLLWLMRDLRAFANYLVATLAREQPERQQEVDEWIRRLFGSDTDLLAATRPAPQQRGSIRRHHLERALRDVTLTLHTPTGGADTLVAFLRDVITARYPQPGDAMLLAAIWMWRQPPSTVRRLTEHDVAALLLVATLVGGEEGLFAPTQMVAPEPLQRAFTADDWRDWRQWGIPVGANFLQDVWRVLAGSSRSGFAPEVRQGVQALRSLLPFLSAEDRADLIDHWMGTLEQRAEELASPPQGNGQGGDNNASVRDELPPDVLAQWWRPLDSHPSSAEQR